VASFVKVQSPLSKVHLRGSQPSVGTEVGTGDGTIEGAPEGGGVGITVG